MKRITAVILSLAFLLCGCKGKAPATVGNAAAQAENKITVTWDKSDTAEFYRVYRLEDGEDNYRFIDDTKELSYTDETAAAGITYRYKITAVKGSRESSGRETEKVTIKSESTQTKAALKVPSISSVTKMDMYTNAVQFSSAGTDCTYEIFRSPAIDGAYTSLGTTEETVWYDDTADGKTFYYKVTALRGEEKAQASNPCQTGKNARRVFRVPVIMYHEFVTQSDLSSGIPLDEYAIYQNEFEEDLIWLKNNGYTTITCRQLADYMEGKDKNIPAKPILLTADDGKYGVYKNAYPLLKKYGVTLSLAIIGYEIDSTTESPEARSKSTAPFCTWSEIAEMADSGAVEIISHTQNMHIFSHDNRTGANCAEGEEYSSFLPAAQADFAVFNRNLKEHSVKPTVAMAYPYSKRSVTADKAWIASGYKVLLGGDDDKERKTQMNYFVFGAGINSKSAVLRRLPRMINIPLKNYINDAVKHDGN